MPKLCRIIITRGLTRVMSKGKQEAQGSLPRERCIALVHTVHRLQPMPAGVIPLRAGQARTHAVQDSRGLTALVLEMAQIRRTWILKILLHSRQTNGHADITNSTMDARLERGVVPLPGAPPRLQEPVSDPPRAHIAT